MILKAYFEEIECDKAYKGKDYIKAYKNDTVVLYNTNLVDFSNYELTGGNYEIESNMQLREQVYEMMLYKADGTALITWENEAITVDIANKKWLDYSAEGSTVANELSALIVTAKAYIRELYPDNPA